MSLNSNKNTEGKEVFQAAVRISLFAFPLLAFAGARSQDEVKLLADVQNCSAAQQSVIEQVQTIVHDRVLKLNTEIPTYTFEDVRTRFIEPEDRVYDPQSPVNASYSAYISRLSGVFQKMAQEVNRGVNFACRSDASEPHCRGGEVVAYVLMDWSGHSLPRIYACDGFFRDSGTDIAGVAETTLHELSHYAADTEDYGLDWWNAQNLDLVRATNDAYHIQQFSRSDAESVLRRQIWYWLWPRKPEAP